MPRVALCIQYDGSRYCGWQRQHHSPSVQQTLETALAKVSDAPCEVYCAGRTDTGVHATGQIVHLESQRPVSALALGTNSYLPNDVSVLWAQTVDTAFHARFAAVERRYRYLIRCSRTPAALYRQRCWDVHHSLNVAAMEEAGQCLLGVHDFSAFRAAGCQAKHPQRDVRALTVREHGRWVVIDIAANAFLQHMVRYIVGLLVHIGLGKAPATHAGQVLEGRDRTRSAAAAPAHGLYLTQVLYPTHFDLPQTDVEHDAPLPVLPLVPDCA